MILPPYTVSRFRAIRRHTHEVKVGTVGIGGGNPIRVQSMTTSPTLDVEATVKQSIALAEVGCEIVRITAQNVEAARALHAIRKGFSAAGFAAIPLVADIHFLPAAAMEAAEHVEKVRINPGNYADKKKFSVKEYSDNDYDEEIERLHEAFSPIVLKCRDLGRAMRIGTNHGSLSDRIMNRYGDTPLGMCESALEFLRIAESHGYRDICISMKASNPKVMIEAYRLMVAKMELESMHYPLHLGVTEAGDGDDARIKSSIGIGSLLWDGLGDTIRVSLTEDPWYEIPVAIDLARKAELLWKQGAVRSDGALVNEPLSSEQDATDPYHYSRRECERVELSDACVLASDRAPTVIVATHHPLREYKQIAADVIAHNARFKDARVEGLLLTLAGAQDIDSLALLRSSLREWVEFLVLDITALTRAEVEALVATVPATAVAGSTNPTSAIPDLFLIDAVAQGLDAAADTARHLLACGKKVALSILPDHVPLLKALVNQTLVSQCIITLSSRVTGVHNLGLHRQLVEALRAAGSSAPLWIRNTDENTLALQDFYADRLMEAAILSGGLLCDGVGDLISVETEPNLAKATLLAYNILQGARMRSSKTEFVACPSCGRTLFDLQSTTQRIRERTGHLKGVTIAVMGCIVNGPGEMADADFGYVGGAPGKVNLYVGKTCVKYNVATEEAVDRLVDLIKEHRKWIEPEAIASFA
ncbi:MAG: (E)-4-hydroxy-3-methylbut-2-enyl-diphosphate synthase [Verrucomicrobiota bacterium]|nr:(E)-4-hydroxy-3-methylbut-2-enyl-diphosphate synthase [Verrucomicrobiota bacterium]